MLNKKTTINLFLIGLFVLIMGFTVSASSITWGSPEASGVISGTAFNTSLTTSGDSANPITHLDFYYRYENPSGSWTHFMNQTNTSASQSLWDNIPFNVETNFTTDRLITLNVSAYTSGGTLNESVLVTTIAINNTALSFTVKPADGNTTENRDVPFEILPNEEVTSLSFNVNEVGYTNSDFTVNSTKNKFTKTISLPDRSYTWTAILTEIGTGTTLTKTGSFVVESNTGGNIFLTSGGSKQEQEEVGIGSLLSIEGDTAIVFGYSMSKNMFLFIIFLVIIYIYNKRRK